MSKKLKLLLICYKLIQQIFIKTNELNKIFRTTEALKPAEISALLGIEVNVASVDTQYYKDREMNWLQTLVVTIMAVILAIGGIIGAMYFYEVGVFHQLFLLLEPVSDMRRHYWFFLISFVLMVDVLSHLLLLPKFSLEIGQITNVEHPANLSLLAPEESVAKKIYFVGDLMLARNVERRLANTDTTQALLNFASIWSNAYVVGQF